MPVHAHQVPLDTAKSWAKQLGKSSKTLAPESPWPLSRCQKAVAQMLGFDHWHALEQGPTTATSATSGPTPEPYFHRGDLPVDLKGWQGLWRDVLGSAQGAHLEFRPNKAQGTIRILLRMHDRLVRFLELEGASLVPALQALFDGSPDVSTQQLLQTKTPAYLDAVLPLKPLEEKSHYRYQTLPVYPKGWDMVIRQEGKSLDTWSVSKMDLPPRLLEALLQICRRPTGLVLFTGTVGSGKSTLMKAMVRQMNANTRPSLKPNQPIPGSSRVGKICALDNTITDRDLSDVKHLDVYAPHATIDPQDILRSDVDRVLMGELSSSKQARNMKKLLQSGVSV